MKPSTKFFATGSSKKGFTTQLFKDLATGLFVVRLYKVGALQSGFSFKSMKLARAKFNEVSAEFGCTIIEKEVTM